MKKIFTLMLLALSVLTASAQQTKTIYVWQNGAYTPMEAVDSVTFSAPAVTEKYVDLGLSVLWATYNVGASTPEGSGDYFAWGETEPKDDYSWSTYKWGTSARSLTKYTNDDGLTVLESSDDAASVVMGDDWRMPTRDEFDELVENCTWTWTTRNDVAGYEVKGQNGKSIFLPAAGSYIGTDLGDEGSYGYYWTSSRYSSAMAGYKFEFGPDDYSTSMNSRYYGFTVRAVKPKEAPHEIVVPEPVDLGLSVKWAEFNVGADSPEGLGNYYAWGETEVKSDYSYSNYAWGSNYDNATKYTNTDGLTNLESSDDAAAQLYGGDWRMPTEEELKELIDNCTWTWEENNGVAGYQIVAANGNSIFLPAGGYKDGEGDAKRVGTDGSYWTSTSYADGYSFAGQCLDFNTNRHRIWTLDRYQGMLIRAVLP